jgi:hypothetical protein
MPARRGAVRFCPARSAVLLESSVRILNHCVFQSCLKRGMGATCAYPEPDNSEQPPGGPSTISANSQLTDTIRIGIVPPQSITQFAPPMPYPPLHPSLAQPPYYDYNAFANPPPQPAPPPPPSASTTSSTTATAGGTPNFRPNKRPRNLTEEETAAITRNWTRGDFFIGNSGPVRIDPRLPVKLTLGEGDHVHFTIGGEPIV